MSHLRSSIFFNTVPADRDELLAYAQEYGKCYTEYEEIKGFVDEKLSKHTR